ncbi:chymotrypsin family serine protease [Paenibacillus aestuarii]|uniref:Serine protease n=1 Tax=Paenibacillus aestuarii TaxID=516965 RepID=A0ABW0KA49_9BACL|nr:hypothetical protein [Paenibacillus aestuarii]
MATFYEALKHKNRLSPTLLKRAEVMAVGVGYADPSNPSRGAGVIVYTHKKVTPSHLTNLKASLVKAGTTVPVRFISAGKFTNHVAKPKPKAYRLKQIFRNRIRPVPGGVSIGKPDPFSTGTAGVIVIKNNQLFILSNNHVLIKNNSTAFSATVQPGPADAPIAGNTVGRAFQFVPLRPGQVNFQDSAIALPTSNSLLNPRYLISAFQLVTVPGHLLSYPVGLQVMKTGRTSGFVRGTVEANNVDVNVTYGGSLGTLLFRNQSVIVGNNGTAVSQPGDSGSVWLRASDRFAAALNFAGSSDGRRSISNPLGLVMSTYGLRIAIPAAGGGFTSGAIKGAAPRGNYSYVQPLTPTQRARTRAILVKSK